MDICYSLAGATCLLVYLDDPDLVVIDATVLIEPDGTGNLLSVNDRKSYAADRFPGTAFADLSGDLSRTNSEFEFAAPSAEQFAAAVGDCSAWVTTPSISLMR